MGVVYLVRDMTAGGREVALKLQRSDVADPRALERFMREAKMLASLNHPGVIKVHSTGWLSEGPFLLMEFVEGQVLSALREPLAPREAARITRDVASAVAALHRDGLLHRDIKPANVILRTDGSPVLLDFGLARDAREERLTQTGDVLGTPCYMSPEQADGKSPEALGAQVDVYGLGAFLFELLTGRPPYQGSPVQVVLDILAGEPPLPSALNAEVPQALDAIFRKATRLDPSDRYADGADLSADLDRFLAGDAPLALEGFRPPRTALPLVGVACVLLALTVGGLAWTQRGPADTETQTTFAAPKLRSIRVGFERGNALISGTVKTDAPWATVRVAGGEEAKVDANGAFKMTTYVPPGTDSLSVVVVGPGGETKPRVLRVINAWPAWFRGLPAAERPPDPLPEGLSVSDETGEYVWERDGSVLVWVPSGTFHMGNSTKALMVSSEVSSRTKGEKPPAIRVKVTLTRGVFMGKFEVTWRQWVAYCTANGVELPDRVYDRRHVRHSDGQLRGVPVPPWTAPLDHPASNVAWNDASAYCAWAGLRLPTEAEWERAARGDRDQVYVWGDRFVAKAANGSTGGDGYEFTSPGGRFPQDRSPFGCYDMAGNVCELVSDFHAPYPPGPVTDPKGPDTSEKHSLRGSCWAYEMPVLFAISFRDGRTPDESAKRWGFRVALSPASR